MSKPRKKVVLAMSGGVDSSVAAALLLRDGYDVLGVFMRLGSPDGVESESELASADASALSCEAANEKTKNKQGCCSVLDAHDARRVAAALEIPLYVLNFQDDFARVIDYFVDEYNKGRTPNPCVRCNDWLKFGKLAKYAQAVGADYVASGHYARIGNDPVSNEPALLRGLDHRKDQSYVLFGMSRETIAHTLLPIGEYEKPAVREIARELKLPVYNKPDSQEICFVPDQDYAGLVKRRSPQTFRAGELVDAAGQSIGTHEGHQHFTIGQRKGLGVAWKVPLYVVGIDSANNRVTVGEKQSLLKRSLVAHQINLLSERMKTASDLPCLAKVRYNQPPQPARASRSADDELHVTFDDAQSAITPGQALVLYDGDVVLGGGWIDSASD
jgi:tRNA-specific 2-thiouridylase